MLLYKFTASLCFALASLMVVATYSGRLGLVRFVFYTLCDTALSSVSSSVVMELSEEKFNRLVAQAQQIGLTTPKDIQKYIQDATDREDRARDREQKQLLDQRETDAKIEAERAKIEAEKVKAEALQKETDAKIEAEKERLRIEHEKIRVLEDEAKERIRIEHEKAEAEKEKTRIFEEESKARLELEKEKAQQELALRQQELEGRNRRENGSRSDVHASVKGYYPKLPNFNPEKDDIDAFIFRFEAHATALKWERASWPIHFAASLQGASLTFYQSLCSAGPIEFDTLKEQFLKKYQCTEEGFRERFRAAKPEVGESFVAFFTRLRHLFERWIDLSRVAKTFDGVIDLLLREQILQSVCRELNVFLRERKFSTAKDMCDAAELFKDARQGKSMARKDTPNVFVASVGTSQSQPQGSHYQRGGRTGRNSYRGNNRGGHTPQFVPSQGHSGSSVDSNTDSTTPKRGSTTGRPGYRRPNRGQSARQFVPADTCRKCGNKGHWAADCALNKKSEETGSAYIAFSSCCSPGVPKGLHADAGTVNCFAASVLRDSGCNTSVVSERFVRDDQYLPEQGDLKCIANHKHRCPKARVTVHTPYFDGELECFVVKDLVADLVIGNIEGVPDMVVNPTTSSTSDIRPTACVTTRSQARKLDQAKTPLPTPISPDLDVTREVLAKAQEDDITLSPFFQKARDKIVITNGSGCTSYEITDEVLYRSFQNKKISVTQIVVPTPLRNSVLFTAHDAILAGHNGVRRTVQRVLLRFWWPGVRRDVRSYVRTCDTCQKTIAKGKVHRVPLEKMPHVDTPFKRIAIDLIGPFKPVSRNGYTHVLTIVDVATRYPEAIPLRHTDSVSVAEALMSVCSRVGFPEEILSDQGPQFASDLMKEFCKLISVHQVHSSPYHPMANGQVERFNGVLKTMLRKVVHDHPENWDRYIPALLFAYRELPNESTGFSPFELVYGRRPRGPMDILANIWSETHDNEGSKPLFQYVLDLKNTLSDTAQIAQENISKAAAKNKYYFDKKAVDRSFQVGDEVLVLLPTDSNKLLMSWKGPFRVVQSLAPDYRIQMGKKQKIFHANMLQKYHRRSPVTSPATGNVVIDDKSSVSPPPQSVGEANSELFPFHTESCVGFDGPFKTSMKVCESDRVDISHTPTPVLVTECCTDDDGACSYIAHASLALVGVISHDIDDEQPPLPTVPTVQGETFADVNFDSKLEPSQREDLENLFAKFSDLLTDKPGDAKGVVHEIDLTSDVPVRLKPYPLPFASRQVVEKEVKTMLELGVIEPSKSSYSSPVVLVSKKDGSVRFCIDFRALNKVTVFDSEPIPNPEELFCRLAGAHYFTKIDLAKGYWQLPVRPEDKHKTAFQTTLGLFQWTRMPFGLVTAPATFARMMRLLSLEEHSAMNFFDDCLVASASWSDHLAHAEGVLEKLRKYGLTARPSKLFAGFQELEFLGHVVSQGILKPEAGKVQKILQTATPVSKRQVRALLGLLSYYRKYVPHFSSLTAPLSDLTRADCPRKITWTDECDHSLRKIQQILASFPVLQIPDLSQQFVVRTDASSIGLGAVLLQEKDGLLHPVAFVSRKLLDRETRYSTIERECLAIVWSLSKLSRYLWGQEFVLQTDHKPLSYLNSGKFKNARITRWALALQEYRFTVEPVKGTLNVFADYLSRSLADQFVQ